MTASFKMRASATVPRDGANIRRSMNMREPQRPAAVSADADADADADPDANANANANADERGFSGALASFNSSAARVVNLGRRRIVNSLARLDHGSGEAMSKMLRLMDDIKLSLQQIRRKLLR